MPGDRRRKGHLTVKRYSVTCSEDGHFAATWPRFSIGAEIGLLLLLRKLPNKVSVIIEAGVTAQLRRGCGRADVIWSAQPQLATPDREQSHPASPGMPRSGRVRMADCERRTNGNYKDARVRRLSGSAYQAQERNLALISGQ